MTNDELNGLAVVLGVVLSVLLVTYVQRTKDRNP